VNVDLAENRAPRCTFSAGYGKLTSNCDAPASHRLFTVKRDGHNERMSAIVVNTARPEDAEQVVSIYEWLFAPPGGRPPDWTFERAVVAVRRLLSSDTATLLVARLEGELVGFCTVYEDIESIRFGRRVWVEDLAVHPQRRSAGIGKQLLDEAKRWARERGAQWLRLESGEARTDAHRFYDREQPSSRSIAFGWKL
jgi:GNAT superfamily N-acetyltransferase